MSASHRIKEPKSWLVSSIIEHRQSTKDYHDQDFIVKLLHYIFSISKFSKSYVCWNVFGEGNYILIDLECGF